MYSSTAVYQSKARDGRHKFGRLNGDEGGNQVATVSWTIRTPNFISSNSVARAPVIHLIIQEFKMTDGSILISALVSHEVFNSICTSFSSVIETSTRTYSHRIMTLAGGPRADTQQAILCHAWTPIPNTGTSMFDIAPFDWSLSLLCFTPQTTQLL